MSEVQCSAGEQCQLAELLHDLTVAEEYAYGRADWGISAAEESASIGIQLLRCCSFINILLYYYFLCHSRTP